ncbi:hypothetical protein EV361DRAFT_865894 [Lentinula raphanica]|uniref:UBX domain-containing protein n=1 Tax=Lentinula raphanica TaxID=153919 RepID=A0AA38PBX3_9AGAR|nr:hypothetical protein F5880DRAFT_502602 [Lentinula raphanica]KAJ3840083.1 hypothetical protein F5878DRAFT_614250 [Lentinula raphanica]KAJ3974779.1 hypothetical protein EV361DRAFT_865894 [Lentinula raphanica]
MDISSLTPSQASALSQLRDLTNGGDDEVAMDVLSSVDWDIQRAAEIIFDGQAGGSSSSRAGSSRTTSTTTRGNLEDSYGRRYEEFNVDDSEQGLLRPREPPRQSTSVLSLITYPLHLISSLVRFIFNFLRIPLPYIPFLSLNFYRRASGRTAVRRAGGGIERWIRELEEETGAICAGASGSVDATGVQVNPSVDTASDEAGPSVLTSRHTADRPGSSKLLPPFQLGTYDSILRSCQSSFRIGCIVLVSAEHDSTAEFKSSTLTNNEFVQLLVENDIICWGGDIRDKEAYEASMKLGATTYPFVAFIGMQPSRNFTSSSGSHSTTASQSTPALTVLSRHLGASSCTSSALITHLRDTLLPRVKPYLDRTRAQREAVERERARERELREAQDRAFEETKRRDKERILRKMEEEKAELQRKQAEEDQKRKEHEMLERERLQALERAEERDRWRAWFRQTLPVESNAKESIRIAVRMPDGRRLMRRFDVHSDTLDTLYAYVDTELVSTSVSSSSLPSSSYSFDTLHKLLSSHVPKPNEWWGFVLVSAYPRQPIPWSPNTRLGDLKALSGGQLVVEMVHSRILKNGGKGKSKDNTQEEDEYETESSDED